MNHMPPHGRSYAAHSLDTDGLALMSVK